MSDLATHATLAADAGFTTAVKAVEAAQAESAAKLDFSRRATEPPPLRVVQRHELHHHHHEQHVALDATPRGEPR